MNRLRTKLRTKPGATVGLIPDRKIQKREARKRATPFNPHTFLARVGHGKTTLRAPKEHLIFSQGDAANAVFYVQAGRVKLTVVSQQGNEAVVAILDPEDFSGEGCLAGQLLCMAIATALDASMIVRIDKAAMIRVLHDEPSFSKLFVAYLLSRNVRIPRGLSGSSLQFFREAAGVDPPVAGPLWEGGQAGAGHSKDQPKHASRHGRHHTVASQFISE